MSVTLVKSDWYVPWQATVPQITAIRHWGITNMSGVIKENPCYVVFKKSCLSECIHAKRYNVSVAFHSIVMLMRLGKFLSRVLIWASSSCSCVHPGHHGLYRFIWLCFNANNYPSDVKNSINRTRFLNNFPLALRLRIWIGIASRGVVNRP